MTGPDSMRVTVVIVSWNTRELLAECLASLEYGFSEPGSGIEIAVVDNASCDGSAQMVRERFPGVQLIENAENRGFARACNQAIRRSRARYVLLLNPDCRVPAGALGPLIDFLERHPGASVVGPRLVDEEGMLQESCYRFPTLSRELYRLLHLDGLYPWALYPQGRWSTEAPREVDAVQGACFLVRHEVLERVGLLDEDYFLYSEEIDLCHRIRQAGGRIFWVPSSTVVHHGGRSTEQRPVASFLLLYGGKVRYFRKRHGPGTARVYKAVLLAAALPRVLLAPAALLEPAQRRARHLRSAGYYVRMLSALWRF